MKPGDVILYFKRPPAAATRCKALAFGFGLAFIIAGCAPEARTQTLPLNGGRVIAEPANGDARRIVPAYMSGNIEAGSQTLLKSPAPPKIIAQAPYEVRDAIVYASNAGTKLQSNVRRGIRWIEAAQIGLIYGSPQGRDFLAAPAGRALVRGEPAENCPAIAVGGGASNVEAVQQGFDRCFAQLNGRLDCGCRLIAQGDQLLAPQDDFAYALGVAARIYDPVTGAQAIAAAEERMLDERQGARHVWLLSPTGPMGVIQLEADGRAALIFSDTGARYDGRHYEDGLRRGRIARRIYVTAPSGRRLVALVGYEEAEVKERRADLLAWTPHLNELRRAEAQ